MDFFFFTFNNKKSEKNANANANANTNMNTNANLIENVSEKKSENKNVNKNKNANKNVNKNVNNNANKNANKNVNKNMNKNVNKNVNKNMEGNKTKNNVEKIKNTNIIVNIPRNIELNAHKYHFFIGNYLSDFTQINILRNIQNKLKKNFKIKDNYFVNKKICLKMVYVGYFTTKLMYHYMNIIFSKLLESIVEKLNKLDCHYTEFSITQLNNGFLQISLGYTDENNDISNIIVPYLFDNGIKPIFNKKTIEKKQKIDLLYAKPNTRITGRRSIINIKIPIEHFSIDKISLIKGIPLNSHIGAPSQFDQMNFEEVSDFSYKFLSNNSTSTNNLSQITNSNVSTDFNLKTTNSLKKQNNNTFNTSPFEI